MNERSRIRSSLLLLRLGVFPVVLIEMGPGLLGLLAGLELLVFVGFLVDCRKRLTYGAILLLDGVSTLSSYAQYTDPLCTCCSSWRGRYPAHVSR